MPDAKTITVGSTTYDLRDDSKVPVAGLGKNLLDNWYFVGGGSQQGGGQFPINQMCETSYATDATSACSVDRWHIVRGILSINANGITFTGAGDNSSIFGQTIETNQIYGKQCTISHIDSDGLKSKTFNFPTSGNQMNIGLDIAGVTGWLLQLDARSGTYSGINIRKNNTTESFTLKAIKLELGDTQTLAHQENGVWALNEVPNYAEQLARCQRYCVNLTLRGKARATIGIGSGNTSSRVGIIADVPPNFNTGKNPTAIYTGNFCVVKANLLIASEVKVNTISALEQYHGTGKILLIADTDAGQITVGDVYYLRAYNDSTAKLLISADL